MATTLTNGWTTYAVLAPSKPQFNKKGEPVEWKVQTNAAGQWRCYCPSFIFSKLSPKTCKHIRRCQQELATEQGIPVPVQPIAAYKHPQWDSAYTICAAMLDQARLFVNDKQREQLVTVLAQKLAAFVPHKPVATAAKPQLVEVGVRRITFDD